MFDLGIFVSNVSGLKLKREKNQQAEEVVYIWWCPLHSARDHMSSSQNKRTTNTSSACRITSIVIIITTISDADSVICFTVLFFLTLTLFSRVTKSKLEKRTPLVCFSLLFLVSGSGSRRSFFDPTEIVGHRYTPTWMLGSQPSLLLWCDHSERGFGKIKERI